MNTITLRYRNLFGVTLSVLIAAGSFTRVHAVVTTITDNFNTSHNYLANGVAGTIWDGMYTGAGSVPGGNTGSAPGATLVADANITGAGRLTVQSYDTGWQDVEDDGFFLYKNVGGDFQMEVHIVAPFDAGAFNMGGLMVRASGPGGAPFNGSENWIWLTHFSQFAIGNYVQNTINGLSTQLPLNSPGVDLNYWLRIDRVNDTSFYFYQKAQEVDPWQLIGFSPINRADLAGIDLQVGIVQQTFSPNIKAVQFDDFVLSVIPEPSTSALAGGGLLAGLLWKRSRRGLQFNT